MYKSDKTEQVDVGGGMNLYELSYYRPDPKDSEKQILCQEFWLAQNQDQVLERNRSVIDDMDAEFKSIIQHTHVLGVLRSKQKQEVSA